MRVLPDACAIARWKAKSSLTAPPPRGQHRLDRAQRALDRGEARRRDPRRRQCRSLDLDGQPQLHDFQHIADGAQAFGIDAEGNPAGVAGNERAGPLAGRHQAVRPQCGNRFAHDRAADAHGGHQLLLGRQPRARRKPALANLAGDAFHHLVGEVARAQRSRQAARVGGRAWRRAGNLSGHRTNSRGGATVVQGFAFRMRQGCDPCMRRRAGHCGEKRAVEGQKRPLARGRWGIASRSAAEIADSRRPTLVLCYLLRHRRDRDYSITHPQIAQPGAVESPRIVGIA